MYLMKLIDGPRAKSADVVGQTMALNPHGDGAIYETLVRLTRGHGALLQPWIDSKGNMGRVYSRDMQYAASRYTEVRLDPAAHLIFDGLNRDSVDFTDNYSGTMKEPVLLPAALPTILVNSNQGIAVGMASTIASFNLQEVCDATVALIDDREANLLNVMPAPDFSTAGELIYDEKDMAQIYATGRGSFRLRAKYTIDKKKQRIIVSEIPYNTTVETIIDDIANAVKKGRFKEISDVRDETDLNGLSIAIEYKRSADPDILIQKLLQSTALETWFACNFNVLINGEPKVLGVRELLFAWLAWRRTCIRREAEFLRGEKEKALHLLYGLRAIVLDIDKAIRIIRETEYEKDVIDRLMEGFSIDRKQAEYVAEIKLRQLNREVLLRRMGEIEALEKEVAELIELAGSKRRIDRKIKRQLIEIGKKYGRERLTKLVPKEKRAAIDKEDLIEDYNVRVLLTRDGYVKKLALTSLRGGFDLKLKEDDEIVCDLESSNKETLLLLSDKCALYKIPLYEIADQKPSDLGEFAANLLELDDDEQIILILTSPEEKYDGHFMFAYANGKALRVPLSAYETKSFRRKLVNAYSDKAPLAAVKVIGDEPIDLMFLSDAGKLLIVKSDLIPEKVTRSSQGVTVMRLGRNQKLTGVELLSDWPNFKSAPFVAAKIPHGGRLVKDKLLLSRQLSFGG
jgi:DNA gyrase subunit A